MTHGFQLCDFPKIPMLRPSDIGEVRLHARSHTAVQTVEVLRCKNTRPARLRPGEIFPMIEVVGGVFGFLYGCFGEMFSPRFSAGAGSDIRDILDKLANLYYSIICPKKVYIFLRMSSNSL